MDIVMQRMTITNVEADMDRLIKVIFAFIFLLHATLCIIRVTHQSDLLKPCAFLLYDCCVN